MGKKVPDKKQAKAEARFAADDALTAVASCVPFKQFWAADNVQVQGVFSEKSNT